MSSQGSNNPENTHSSHPRVCSLAKVVKTIYVFLSRCPTSGQEVRSGEGAGLPGGHLDLRPGVCSFLPAFQSDGVAVELLILQQKQVSPALTRRRAGKHTQVNNDNHLLSVGCRGDHYNTATSRKKKTLADPAQKANASAWALINVKTIRNQL